MGASGAKLRQRGGLIMTRRTAQITITREGRDKGAIVCLEEPPVGPETEWLMRAGMLLARSGVDVPADILHHGVTGFVALGVGTIMTGLGKAPWAEVKPLLDELLQCVTGFQPPTGREIVTGGWTLYMLQIQEPATIMQIYEEVLSLMVGFSVAAELLTWTMRTAAIVKKALDDAGQNTRTSAEKSPSSSEAAMPS